MSQQKIESITKDQELLKLAKKAKQIQARIKKVITEMDSAATLYSLATLVEVA